VVDDLLEEALLAPRAPDNHAVVVASAQLFRTFFRVSGPSYFDFPWNARILHDVQGVWNEFLRHGELVDYRRLLRP
jgi:hypothetical protein